MSAEQNEVTVVPLTIDRYVAGALRDLADKLDDDDDLVLIGLWNVADSGTGNPFDMGYLQVVTTRTDDVA